jgi:hypothetical protein
VARVPWPHLQWASALILSWADAWLSTNFRGNIPYLSFLDQAYSSLLIMTFGHPLQNTVPASRARALAYNVVGPISALGFKSTTLAQLMARYATMDPTLASSTSTREKLYPWLYLQLPRRKEPLKRSSLR